LFAALAIGAVPSVLLSIAVRRLSGFGGFTKIDWGALSTREAMSFGVISWGIPLGLVLSLNDFLQNADRFAVVRGLVIWPLAGVAFGLLARWLARRRGA
jgi:hypothetical protein